MRLPLFLCLVLLLVLAAYQPALHGDFLWDDGGHVTRADLQTGAGLLRIWTEPGVTQQYYPLLHSAFWLEQRLWGESVLGYHLANVLWHSLSAFLLVLLLRRLAVPGAWLAGLVFALHPVAVESVAWISEQKNTLSTLLYLGAALAWLRFEEKRSLGRYLLATLLFAGALLSKSVTATLPAALLVLAWWRRGRLSWRVEWIPLLPWLGLGLAAGLFTAHLEAVQIGASGSAFALSPASRVVLAGHVLWFYLGKLLYPVGLSFFYPRWTPDASEPVQWLWPLAALGVLGLAAVWRVRSRAPLAALLLYGGTLVPVLGFVNVYPFVFSYVADHFQYLASLGMIASLSAGVTWAALRFGFPQWLRVGGAGLLLTALGLLTWRQSAGYRDVFSLYETTLARNPDSWVAHLNLGVAMDDAGRTEEALPHLQRALELKPDHPETLNSLGSALSRLGRPGEALGPLERAVQLQPRFAAAQNSLGVALMALGRFPAGKAAFERAVALEPSLVDARVNLGWALANAGFREEALAQLAEARRLQPGNAGAEFKTALSLCLYREFAHALPHARRAVELQPENPDLRHILGSILLDLGRAGEAAEQFEAALQIDPGHEGARQGLERLGRAPLR